MPWDDEKNVVVTRPLKERSTAMTVGLIGMGVLLVAGGIMTQWKISTVFGVLYLLALLQKKAQAVTSRGLEQYFKIFFIKKHYVYEWDSITQMVIEKIKGNSEVKAAHIFVGDRDRKQYIRPQDVSKLEKLAKAAKPEIAFEYVNK